MPDPAAGGSAEDPVPQRLRGTAEREQMFNDKYAGLFEVLRRHADVIDVVTFWNVSDRDTWLGTTNYPLLFDKDGNPKDAYYKVRDFTPTKEEKAAARLSKKKASKKRK